MQIFDDGQCCSAKWLLEYFYTALSTLLSVYLPWRSALKLLSANHTLPPPLTQR